MRWLAIPALVLTAHAQTLPEALKARIGNFPGTVSLYAKNLDTGATLSINGADPVRTASTIKLPITRAAMKHFQWECNELGRTPILSPNASSTGGGPTTFIQTSPAQ